MKRRFTFVSVALLTILSVTLGACAAPTPEVVEKIVTQVVEKVVTQVVEVEKEVTKIVEEKVEVKVVVTATPEPMVVTFMSWAEDDFEVGALEELIKRFKKAHPEVTVECEIVTIVPAKGKDICTVVTAEGDLIR